MTSALRDISPPLPSAPPDARPTYAIAQADAVEWLRALPDASVDLVITDPAYESLEKHRAVGTTTRLKHSKSSSNDWFTIFPNSRFLELFREVHRVLRKDSHFYLFCDPETAFVAKPLAEQAGFKFWKPLVWDKCLGPETPVRTDRGVVRIADITENDRVFAPNGKLVSVLATRRTRAPSVRIALSNGQTLIASNDHRFALADRTLREAQELAAGTELRSGQTNLADVCEKIPLEECIDDAERVLELPDASSCLFCGREFESSRAASAHQARFCEQARSKAEMAAELGIAPKRLRRWMSEGRLPASWANALGLDGFATGRTQGRLQNDTELWFPESLPLDYGWGKLIGLYAAEGFRTELSVSFALHKHEKHLQHHIARMARSLRLNSSCKDSSEMGCVVQVHSKMFSSLMMHFVGGGDALTKYFLPSVYRAPLEFQRGVFDGLIEGDGHWSDAEHRETLNLASLDLASFALRFARHLGWEATIHRIENARAGAWRVRFDPAKRTSEIRVVSVEHVGECDLVDIAIDDPSQLYELNDGVVTHNCSIGMGYHYRSRYEFILFFEKGKRKLHDLGIADVITQKRIRNGYPTEKPVEVSEVLVKQSSEEGALIVDPFMGSGSVGLAALRNGRHFAGADISASAYDTAKQRFEAEGAVPAQAGTQLQSAGDQISLKLR